MFESCRDRKKNQWLRQIYESVRRPKKHQGKPLHPSDAIAWRLRTSRPTRNGAVTSAVLGPYARTGPLCLALAGATRSGTAGVRDTCSRSVMRLSLVHRGVLICGKSNTRHSPRDPLQTIWPTILGGHSTTGLSAKCWALCEWPVSADIVERLEPDFRIAASQSTDPAHQCDGR